MTLRAILIGAVAGLAAGAAGALAQDSVQKSVDAAPPPAGPICNAAVEGQLACMANRACECVYSAAEAGRGLPARWRWDCSIKRGQCAVTPEGFVTYPYVSPYAVDLDDEAELDAEDGAEIPPQD